MQALTKLNPTDPVRFDSMNAILGEIEGRDNELAKQLNVLNGMFKERTITLANGWVAKDNTPLALKNGKSLNVYMRISSGTLTAGTLICTISDVETRTTNQFFTIKQTVTGADLGVCYLSGNGGIYILKQLTTNADCVISKEFICLN